MSRVNFGLIGCGGMGKGLAKGALASGAGRLVAICDSNEEVRTKAAEELAAAVKDADAQAAEPAVCADSAELLARSDIRAVFVATPNHTHCERVLEAAQAGKAVFCEKPMALSVADCDRMIDACRSAGVPLMVGQVLRYYAAFAKAIELVEAGRIGKPFAIHASRMGFSRAPEQRTWRHYREFSGGPIFEFGIHEIDFLCCVCGEVESVYVAGGNLIHQGELDYPDWMYLNMAFASGAKGLYAHGIASVIPWNEFKIWGEKGAVFFSSWGGPLRVKCEGGEEESVPAGPAEQPVQRETRLFLEAVRDGTAVPIPGEIGRRNVAIAAAACASLETGKPVAV